MVHIQRGFGNRFKLNKTFAPVVYNNVIILHLFAILDADIYGGLPRSSNSPFPPDVTHRCERLPGTAGIDEKGIRIDLQKIYIIFQF